MSKFLLIVGVFCVVQLANGRVARDAPVATVTTFDEISRQATEAIDNLHIKFLEFMGVKNDNELSALVQDKSKVYADQISALVVKISDEAKSNSGSIEGVFKTVTDKLTEAATELKAKNPDLAKYQDNLESSFKKVIAETQTLSKKLQEDGKPISDNLKVAFEQIYTNTLDTAKEVSASVVNAVKKD